jgi:hypothetical protein
VVPHQGAALVVVAALPPPVPLAPPLKSRHVHARGRRDVSTALDRQHPVTRLHIGGSNSSDPHTLPAITIAEAYGRIARMLEKKMFKSRSKPTSSTPSSTAADVQRRARSRHRQADNCGCSAHLIRGAATGTPPGNAARAR